MKKYQFWCPKCRQGFLDSEVETVAVDTMFGEGQRGFCRTCAAAVVWYANQDLDLHSIILALGERAQHAVWQISGVDCFRANAKELWLINDTQQPVAGNELLRITAGIVQTIDGCLKAFDKGSAAHWFYLRAWDGSGFYIETNDPEIKASLQARFQNVTDDVEEARLPYEALFIPRGD